jgi:hypothetical protein
LQWLEEHHVDIKALIAGVIHGINLQSKNTHDK